MWNAKSIKHFHTRNGLITQKSPDFVNPNLQLVIVKGSKKKKKSVVDFECNPKFWCIFFSSYKISSAYWCSTLFACVINRGYRGVRSCKIKNKGYICPAHLARMRRVPARHMQRISRQLILFDCSFNSGPGVRLRIGGVATLDNSRHRYACYHGKGQVISEKTAIKTWGNADH